MNNKSTKTNSKKEFSIFLTSGFKNSIAVSCTDKESITLSMELAET